MILNSPYISGSLTVTGNIIASGSITLSGSVASASYASNAELLDGLDSTVFTLTSSFAAQTASFTAFTASLNAFSASQNSFTASILAQTASLNAFSASILSYTASQNILNGTYTLTSSFAAQTASFTAFTSSINAFSASILTFTGSASTRLGALESYTSSLNDKTSSFATTGSNTFTGIQTVNSNLVVTGSITAQTLVVQTITSSVDFVTGSTRFGSILGNTHVFSGSVTMNPGGLFVSSSGNVGIGTSSPFEIASTNLSVNGASSAIQLGVVGVRNAQFYADGAEVRLYAVTNVPLRFGTNDTERMRLDISGSLGLGVTPSAWYTGYTALQVGESAALFSNRTSADTRTTQLANNAYLNSGATNWIYAQTDEATRYEQVNGEHNFYSVVSGSAGGNITWGTSKMTITSTGNVGIGTSSPSGKLHLSTTSDTYFVMTGGATPLTYSWLVDATNLRLFNGVGATTLLTIASTGAATFSNAAGITNGNGLNLRAGGNGAADANVLNFTSLAGTINASMFTDAANSNTRLKSLGNLSFHTGNIAISADNERMFISSSGAVGIGTSSPVTRLTINIGGANTSTNYQFKNISVSSGFSGGYTGTAIQSLLAGYDGSSIYGTDIGYGYDGTGYALMFSTNDDTSGNPTERMRVTSDAKILMGTTTYGGVGNSFDNGGGIIVNYSGTGSRVMVEFKNSNGTIGNITGNGSTTTYNTTSDYRLKEDLKDFKGLDLVSAIKTYDYQWKIDESRMYGVIAHELQEVLPYAVNGQKDGKEMQGVDYSKIVPILVKAMQEQQATITSLQSRIETLESK